MGIYIKFLYNIVAKWKKLVYTKIEVPGLQGKRRDDPMVEAYNYYAGGFIPKVNPKTNVHNRRELKNKYKSIVALNNANPLAMISLSKDTSDYALDVKSMSMELGEAASLALDSDQQGEALKTTLQLYNKLLSAVMSMVS